MDTPNYATESDVYRETGITKEVVERMTGLEGGDVADLVNGFLRVAEQDVKDALQIPFIKAHERHLGTGEDDEFDLGPEDEDFYIDYDPSNKVYKVMHCYFGSHRKKKPYPTDCDLGDSADLWDDTGYTQPTNNLLLRQAGDYTMQFVFSAAGSGRYPNVTDGHYIDKNIDIFSYMFLRVRATVANTVLTIRLYDSSDNYNETTYTIVKANKWYKVMLDIDSDFTTSVDWDDESLYYLTVGVNQACTLYVDNVNFNDDWCFTAPSGKLLIMHRSVDEPPPSNFNFYATFTYDPFMTETPENIKSAVAMFAGVKLMDHLIGIRESFTEFDSESLTPIPDKEALYQTRGSTLAKARERLSLFGYGFTFVPAI